MWNEAWWSVKKSVQRFSSFITSLSPPFWKRCFYWVCLVFPFRFPKRLIEVACEINLSYSFSPINSHRSLYRGSYMSAHVLLNLLNELGKRDKMRGLLSILSLFRNELNKFNNTRARMLDSIYHMTNTLKHHFWRYNFVIMCATLLWTS